MTDDQPTNTQTQPEFVVPEHPEQTDLLIDHPETALEVSKKPSVFGKWTKRIAPYILAFGLGMGTQYGIQQYNKPVDTTNDQQSELAQPNDQQPETLPGPLEEPSIMKGYTLHWGKTSTVLGLPEKGSFDPSFSFDKPYAVKDSATIKEVGLGTYMVFQPLTKADTSMYVGVNVVANNKIIAKGIQKAGQDLYIPMDSTLEQAVKAGNLHFQVMALQPTDKDAKDFEIVGSYKNGRLSVVEEKTETKMPVIPADSVKTAAKSDSLEQKVDGTQVQKTDSGQAAILNTYINSRNLEQRTVSNAVVDQWTKDFNGYAFQAANQYSAALKDGKTHFEALRAIAETSDAAAIHNTSTAYQAVQYARQQGSDVVLQRWNRKLFDENKVSDFVKQYSAQTNEQGKKYTQKEIRALVEQEFGAKMSSSTLRSYLRA